MMKEQEIRYELAYIIKDLRARGRREPHPDAMDDNDIIFNTAYACALASTLHKKDLDLKLYAKFLEGWY